MAEIQKGIKHEHYEVLNLIGYGLAKFGLSFVKLLGFKTKTALYNQLVLLGVAATTGVIKNRQDLFDPFFDNNRKGWWQKGDAYIHRKKLIDSLFGELDASAYVEIVKLALLDFNGGLPMNTVISPLLKTRYQKMQETGIEAEFYFMQNYSNITTFENGLLDDARLFGDGYDFQITTKNGIYLAEIKGLRDSSGDIRLTEREYQQALKYKECFALIVVCNMSKCPCMESVFNPLKNIPFDRRTSNVSQTSYVTGKWKVIS